MSAPDSLASPARPDPLAPPLILVGASTRAAAWSAVRAGWRPLCADLFADRDLLDVADSIQVTDYPNGLLDAISELLAIQRIPHCPTLYTGALENHLDVVDALGQPRTTDGNSLYGNPTHVLEHVRDPAWVAQVCGRHNLPCPQTCTSLPARPASDRPQRWILRRRNSAGGSGIEEWNASNQPTAQDTLFQQLIPGQPAAALCLGNGSSASVLGVTRQLVGEAWLGAGRWAWCGSIGPLELPARLADQLARLADMLARESGLLGLFGIDLILDNHAAWPIEINPRYTGSAEVIEMACGQSMIGRHLEAFGEPAPKAFATPADSTETTHAKVVLFAPRDIEIERHPVGDSNWRPADIPHVGTHIDAGRPLCSVLTRGHSVDECLDRAKSAADELYRQFGCPGHSWPQATTQPVNSSC